MTVKKYIDIVAPGSQKNLECVYNAQEVIAAWGWQSHVPKDLFGEDFLYANSDDMRFVHLYKAINNDRSDIIWCVRGGCGSTRLIPRLEKLDPCSEKLFIGFSDITALHLFFYQHWSWSTCIHGPVFKQMGEDFINDDSRQAIKKVVANREYTLDFPLTAFNDRYSSPIHGPITGGNLSLIQASLATSWHIKADDHILILEDVDEQPYRTMERLEHLRQAGVFRNIQALILGDFNLLAPVDNNYIQHYDQVFKKFAMHVDFPVFKTTGIGHTSHNLPFRYGQFIDITRNDNNYKAQG